MPKILDRGLAHGRLWVVNQGCECAECEARRVADRAERQAKERTTTADAIAEGRSQAGLSRRPPVFLSKVRFRKTPRDGWTVIGPPSMIHVGMVAATNAQGQARQVYVHRVGAVFEIDGVLQRYGYIRR